MTSLLLGCPVSSLIFDVHGIGKRRSGHDRPHGAGPGSRENHAWPTRPSPHPRSPEIRWYFLRCRRSLMLISFLLSETAYEGERSANVRESVRCVPKLAGARVLGRGCDRRARIRRSRLRLFCARASSSPRRSVASRSGGGSSSLFWRYSAGSHHTSARSSAIVIAASRIEAARSRFPRRLYISASNDR